MERERTVVRSWGAFALGSVLAIGTVAVLFWDVRSVADLNSDHVMTMAMLLVAIASGHYFLPACKSGNWVAAILLVVLFCAGTFVCVTGSAGRGAEVAKGKEANSLSIEEKRADAKEQLRLGREEREDIHKKWVKCSATKTFDCSKLKSALAAQDSHVAILQVHYNDSKLPPEVNVRLKHAAKVFAFFSRTEATSIEYGLELMWPFALALVMELGTIVFLGLAFGKAVVIPAPVAPAPVPVPAKRPKRTPPGGGGRRGRKAQPEVYDFAARFREKNGHNPSGSDIVSAFPGMPTSTAYDYAARIKRSEISVISRNAA